jgi:serine/threonine-protein kinase
VARETALGRDVVVKVLAAGEAGGLPWFSMPYVAGDSLRDRLRREPRPPLAESVTILRGALVALAAAHDAGIVHRDIKPENVLLSRSGTPTVTDFGIAKAVSAARTLPEGVDATEGLTQVGMSIGTPASMAPEQAAGGAVDHRADLYAWAVMAYELLDGAHPFSGKQNAQQLRAAHLMESPPPLLPRAGDAPAAVVRLVERTLAKSPADRAVSARALLESLERAMHAPPVRASRTARVVIAADWIARGLSETGLVDVAPQPATTLAGDSLIAYARRERAGTVLSGSFYRSGDSLQFVAVLTDVGGKQQFEAVAPVAASPKAPVAALEQLRRRVAGALAARVDPSADVDRMGGGVPPSFEAYRAVLATRNAAPAVARSCSCDPRLGVGVSAPRGRPYCARQSPI